MQRVRDCRLVQRLRQAHLAGAWRTWQTAVRRGLVQKMDGRAEGSLVAAGAASAEVLAAQQMQAALAMHGRTVKHTKVQGRPHDAPTEDPESCGFPLLPCFRFSMTHRRSWVFAGGGHGGLAEGGP